MFCLRSWIPILFFLYAARFSVETRILTHYESYNNASPAFLVIFLSTTYFLNRPCVYCSLLLAILVMALFDFNGDWFIRPHERLALAGTANETAVATSMSDKIGESMGMLMDAVNINAGAIANVTMSRDTPKTSDKGLWGAFGMGWLRQAIAQGELRVDCLNTVIRL